MARTKVEFRQLQRLPVERVRIPQPGKPALREGDIAELARAFKARDRAPPVLVREDGKGRYALVVGEATLAAVQRLDWKELDCVVVGAEADPELKTVRKLGKDGCDAWEAGDALDALKTRYGWTQAQLGLALGRSRDFVASTLEVMRIAPDVRAFIRRHAHGDALTPRHLRYLARTSRSEQMRVALRLLDQRISTKALEREKRLSALRALEPHVIRVRALRSAGSGTAPRNPRQWKSYHRQLETDLKRLALRETAEQKRAQERMAQVRQRLRLIRAAANRKRRQLERELRLAKKQMLRL